ncbi:MAG: PKD domain-containing protein, partial [Candidatus Thermoplasmatota archaeon]|nr:PKD domain-containing protein [Candidatus Thermoplasmatota archaeon]
VSKQPTVQHIYGDDGTYAVTLSMQDIKGAVWEMEYEIIVVNRVPIAIILDETLTYDMDEQPVMLSGEGSYDDDGKIIGYYWDFGDGTHSDKNLGIRGYQDTKVTSHMYDKPGRYTVKLRVMDDDEMETPEAEAKSVEVLITTTVDPDTPISPWVIFGGIIGGIAIMSVGSSIFAWSRKRL